MLLTESQVVIRATVQRWSRCFKIETQLRLGPPQLITIICEAPKHHGAFLFAVKLMSDIFYDGQVIIAPPRVQSSITTLTICISHQSHFLHVYGHITIFLYHDPASSSIPAP
jgi:hypothetical protein